MSKQTSNGLGGFGKVGGFGNGAGWLAAVLLLTSATVATARTGHPVEEAPGPPVVPGPGPGPLRPGPRRADVVHRHAEQIERLARLERRSTEEIILELEEIPESEWQQELERRLEPYSLKWRARSVITKGIFPRGPDFGLMELCVTSGIDGYEWQKGNPGPLTAEAKVGLRQLILPFADTNFGIYVSTEFAIPLQGVDQFIDSLTQEQQAGMAIGPDDLAKGRLVSNRWDMSGGIHGRLLSFGPGNIWRGLFATLGYRGSLWGGHDHGFEAGFGFEVWKVRAGGTWFRSMSGPLKDLGGQMWGVKLEWRFIKAFEQVGL